MKTLIYTSIYNGLFGTYLGGRPSRKLHYRTSLNTILNLNADKFICFTSENEKDELEDYFYNEKLVNRDTIEFISFDLKETKFFDKIQKVKDAEFMKKFDRCYEIQYNKFFWLDIIPEIESYDRVYWFDSGLSHNGLFPEKFAFGEGHDRYFQFNVFKKSFLNNLNNLTKDKIVIVGKNNSGKFFWSNTIPNKYYEIYDNDTHIIGGFFGGKLNNLRKLKEEFEKILIKLLDNEKKLFMEEQILSYLYTTNKKNFEVLKFDDWYKRKSHTENNIKLFYKIFE